MSDNLQSTVYEDFRKKRERAIDEAQSRQDFLQGKIKGLKELDTQLSCVGPRLMFGALDGKIDFSKLEAELREQQQTLMKQREELLRAHGYDADFDSPRFECSKCNDTGYIGYDACPCLKSAIAKKNYLNSGLGKALYNQSFDSFELSYYGGQVENGVSARDNMTNILEFCKSYAENFTGDSESIFMSGATGLGKTHLSSAIAKEVLAKGYSVIYDSAQNIFDAYEAERFGRGEGTGTEKYRSCSLLIIDDLGAEYVTQYSVAVLYNLLNFRSLNAKPMIISTNLGPAELEKSYKSRIYSRLAGEFRVLRFYGQDIRRIKLIGK